MTFICSIVLISNVANKLVLLILFFLINQILTLIEYFYLVMLKTSEQIILNTKKDNLLKIKTNSLEI